MRNIWLKLLAWSLLLGLGSCATPQNVAYFQNAEDIRGMALPPEQPLRLRPEDKINIVVNSSDPMLMQQFNLTSNSYSNRTLGATSTPLTISGGSSSSASSLLAYTVDHQGDIDFPVLGRISVVGKTRMEVANYIRERLIARDLVKDPVVTVEYVNLSVLVLGEVARPGRIEILNDHFTVLDALASVGDLTIIGQRENVMVCREVDGEDETYVIDLCDRRSVLESPAFYLQQNDVIYVTPNPKRQRDYNATGNTFSQPSTWLSMASLVAIVISVITQLR